MTAAADHDGGFSPRLIAGVVAIGVVAFIALWALIALGPQLSSGNDGGGHALSKGAPGYAGVVDLLERSGADVELHRRTEPNEYEDFRQLVILTPTLRTRPDELKRLIDAQGNLPVLVVLPKWMAMRIPGENQRPGWVGAAASNLPPEELLPTEYFGPSQLRIADNRPMAVDSEIGDRRVRTTLPADVHAVDGDRMATLIAAPGGGAVLARAGRGDRRIYVLADPDLINNLAFASRERARDAALLIDAIGDDARIDGFVFDLTLNGFGGQQSLLRFAFVPPFIGITLCLIAAALLALWQAWMRFGPALKPARAIPVSKEALIANSADLIRQARRELDGADAYVASQRSAIARRLHAPAGLDMAATDAWIDRHLKRGGDLFSELARRLPLARNKHEFLNDAQALHDIRKELLRDG